MKAILLGVAFYGAAFAASAAKAADCQSDPINFVFGVDVQTHETVKSGKICATLLQPTYHGGISDIHVQQGAQYGIVGMAGKTRWAYKSRPGYVGKDSYVIQISGEANYRADVTTSGTTNIMVDVDVVR